ARSIRKTMEMMEYPELRERQRRLREEGRCLGIGFSTWIEPTAWGSAMARANGFPFAYYDAASVTVEPDGSGTITSGCQNHRQSHHATVAHVAEDGLCVWH